VEPAKPEPQPTGPRGPAWILAQPASRFTVQLLATASRERWQSYLAARASETRLAGFQMRRDGAIWYVVLFGSYATRAEAEGAATRLPASLGQVEPWVRTFGSIHAIMMR
jgi:DamX protein